MSYLPWPRLLLLLTPAVATDVSTGCQNDSAELLQVALPETFPFKEVRSEETRASSDGPLGSFVHFEAEHQNLMKLLNLKFGAFKYGMFLFHTWDDPNLTLVLRCFGSAGRMWWWPPWAIGTALETWRVWGSCRMSPSPAEPRCRSSVPCRSSETNRTSLCWWNREVIWLMNRGSILWYTTLKYIIRYSLVDDSWLRCLVRGCTTLYIHIWGISHNPTEKSTQVMLGEASRETGGQILMHSSCSVLGLMGTGRRWSRVGTRGCVLGPAKNGGPNDFTSCWRTKMGRNSAPLWQNMSQSSWGTLSAIFWFLCFYMFQWFSIAVIPACTPALDFPFFLSLFLSFFLSFFFSFFLSVCLSVFLSFFLSVFLSFCLSVFLSFCRSVFLSFCLSVFLSFCLSVFLSYCLSVFLSFCRSVVLSFCLSVFLSFFLSFFFLSLSSWFMSDLEQNTLFGT